MRAFAFVLVVAIVTIGARVAVRAGSSDGGFVAASDGRGSITLFWFPPVGKMPAGGFRIDDAAGQTIARVAPDAEGRKVVDAIRARGAGSEAAVESYSVLGLRATSDFAFARSLALATTLTSVGGGAKRYRAVGLGASGAPDGTVLVSKPIDAAIATAAPGAPTAARATVEGGAVTLSWLPTRQNSEVPSVAFDLERVGSDGKMTLLTAQPFVVGIATGARVSYADRRAPADDVTYMVFARDFFGRRSGVASVRVHVPNFAAVTPLRIAVRAEPGHTVVSWTPRASDHTAGYVVERSPFFGGPYTLLTRTPLAARSANYDDTAVIAGSTYYYRVIVVDPQGTPGAPSLAVSGGALGSGKPPTIADLRADIGRTRVRLTWKAAAGRFAGYLVQRRADDERAWINLTPTPSNVPQFDDYFGFGKSGHLSYRVVLVGYDSALSAPSDSVEVALLDMTRPSAPVIRAASGRGGVAELRFAPVAPVRATAQFVVLRGGSKADPGIVVGDPLPGDARSFADRYVAVGDTYWYRLVALDRGGNRSEPSVPIVVRIGAIAVADAPAPRASFAGAPFAHVTIDFTAAPPGLDVFVQRSNDDGRRWRTIAGPMTGTQVVDASPPAKSRALYRIAYGTAQHVFGKSSPPAAVTVP